MVELQMGQGLGLDLDLYACFILAYFFLLDSLFIFHGLSCVEYYLTPLGFNKDIGVSQTAFLISKHGHGLPFMPGTAHRNILGSALLS